MRRLPEHFRVTRVTECQKTGFEVKIFVLNWPVMSPEQNPTENLWKQVKTAMAKGLLHT